MRLVGNLRAQHTSIHNQSTAGLCGTTKEIDIGIGQSAAIDGKSRSQLVSRI